MHVNKYIYEKLFGIFSTNILTFTNKEKYHEHEDIN